MMKRFLSVQSTSLLLSLACIAASSTLAGCAAGTERLRKDIQSDFSELRGIQAEHTAAISEIRAELRTVLGKVEELQYVSAGKTQELEKTLQQLGSRVPPPPGVPEKLLNRDEEKIARIQGAAADSFRKGLSLLRAGDFQGSRQVLADFAEANPGTAFTDNALFWLGIIYTKIGQNDRAVVSFSEVYQTYPAEDMVAPALFYLAETFAKGGSKEDAILTFEKLSDEHPRSQFAVKAKQRLRDLKKGRTRRRRG